MLILGNHDFRAGKYDFWKSVGFDEVYRFPVCLERFIWLSHRPMYMNAHMPYINVHGHIHDNIVYNPFKDSFVNVSVELTGYSPVLFDTLIPNYVASRCLKEIAKYDQK
jgi:calcineurin-like phosphoesterase family protein